MRIPRIYFEGPLEQGQGLSLDAELAHYLLKVLRLGSGDKLHLFNGSDGEFLAVIATAKKNAIDVQLESQVRPAIVPALTLNLALGLSRGDRMDYGIQKSTELGVSRITPIYTEHGEVRLKADRLENKLRHWRKIAINASEQCGRLDVPEICPPCHLEQWATDINEGLKLMLEPSGASSIGAASKAGHINLIIGPEGGFSAEEIKWAEQTGFDIVSLGSRILRTETAPVAALAILQHRYGDM